MSERERQSKGGDETSQTRRVHLYTVRKRVSSAAVLFRRVLEFSPPQSSHQGGQQQPTRRLLPICFNGGPSGLFFPLSHHITSRLVPNPRAISGRIAKRMMQTRVPVLGV